MNKSTEKKRKKFKKTPQPAETTQPISHNSQSQTHKLVSASDELVKVFSRMKANKFFSSNTGF